AGANAAVLLRKRQTHNSELAEFANGARGKRGRSVPLPRIRRNLRLGKLTKRGAQRPLIFRKVESKVHPRYGILTVVYVRGRRFGAGRTPPPAALEAPALHVGKTMLSFCS